MGLNRAFGRLVRCALAGALALTLAASAAAVTKCGDGGPGNDFIAERAADPREQIDGGPGDDYIYTARGRGASGARGA